MPMSGQPLPGTCAPFGSIECYYHPCWRLLEKMLFSVELQDITFTESVAVKLYSDDTLLTTATLNTGKLETGFA